MLNLNSRIKVYETKKLIPTSRYYEFNYVQNVTISSSYKTLTDTATIKMPKKVHTNLEGFNQGGFANANDRDEEKSIHDFFKLENYIEIYLGYDGDYKPAFKGFITSVKGDAPVTITCEDAMYACKKIKAVPNKIVEGITNAFNVITPNPTVTEEKFNPSDFFNKRLGALAFPFKINALDEDLGAMLIKRDQSVCQVFEQLNKQGIYSFFKMEKLGPVLTITNNPQQYGIKDLGDFIERNFIKVPLAGPLIKKLITTGLDVLGSQLSAATSAFSSDQFLGKAKFRFHHNIIEDNLEVVEEAVKNTRIRVEKHFPDTNTPVQIELGKSDGALTKTYKLHANGDDDGLPNKEVAFKKKVTEVAAELYQYAALRAIEKKPSGLKGSFTTFGEPFVRPTDKVIIENAEDKEKNGTFQVEQVDRSFGTSGYRQQIYLGRRVTV